MIVELNRLRQLPLPNRPPTGFTLIELLVVIAIVAVLAVVVILVLNPAQLLAQARDSTRISDMATLKKTISIYLTDVSAANLNMGAINTCFGSYQTGLPNTAGCGGRMAAGDVTVTTSTTPTAINATGWIPINFSLISIGSPIGSKPIDPVNNATYFYSYATNGVPNNQFEIDAAMESNKYSNGGGATDKESTDGGSNPDVYEVGTRLDL